jgi:hypothetical protein
MAGPFTGNPFSSRFGQFQAAVNDPALRAIPGGVVQYVWQDIQQHYAARGESLPAGSFQAVNQLLSLAGQQRRAQLALSRSALAAEETGRPQAITAAHIAPHLDTRALNAMPGGAQHRVVYLTQEIVEGQPVLSYRTHDFGFALPQTLATMNELISSAAQIAAADYGYEWSGVAEPVAIYSY